MPQRIIPSETNAYATFSEQGYEFEELINAVDGEDAETPVSVRFRVFDCDTLTWASEYNLDPKDRSPEYYYANVMVFFNGAYSQIKVYLAFTGA